MRSATAPSCKAIENMDYSTLVLDTRIQPDAIVLKVSTGIALQSRSNLCMSWFSQCENSINGISDHNL